ncbi:unnamed protein product, partial [Closterium sp. NIES-53]
VGGGEFSSDLLAAFCAEHGIRQTFTLPASPQQNGVAERRIGLVMEVARTSMIHAAAPHFLWPFAVRYAAHQLNLWPRVSLPETSPTLLWTGKAGDASRFRVWGARAFVRDTTADKLSTRTVPCVFLGFVPDASGWQLYHPTSRRVFPSQDVTFDESVPFYRVSQVDPPPLTAPVPVTGDSGPAEGGPAQGAEPGGAEPRGTEPGGAAPGGAEASARGPAAGGAGAGDSATGVVSAGGSGAGEGAGARGFRAAEGAGAGVSGATAGAGTEGSESAVARSPWSSRLRPRVPLTSQQLHDWYGRRQGRASGARGSAAGGTSADVTGAGSGAGPGGARTGGTGAAGAGGAELEGAAAGDTEAGDPGTGGAGSGGAATGGAGPGGARAEGSGAAPSSDSVLRQVLSLPLSTGLPLQPGSPLPAPSPYTEQTGGLTERREPASRPVSPVHSGRSGRRVPCSCQPAVPGTHLVVRRPSSPPQSVPLPSPPASSLPIVPEPESDRARAAHPTVTRLLATVVTDPSFESTAASALVAELVDFAAACRLDYAASLVAEFESVCPPSVGGECALGTDVLEDRQEDLECLAPVAPHLLSMLLAPEGDPDAPEIPTPRSYAEAIAGEYSSQWQTAMDAEMASWKSTGTYVDEVPPPGANIVSGMWIFRVKRPPGSPPVFKARYVAQGFSQREGVDFFQTFSPTPKMTTLRVLLHVAAQRDYELHSLDFTTAFLQGSLHEEIWLRRPPGFTGSFPPGTQWSLRTTLAALGFAPSTADPSLFLRTDTSLPPFYILVARRTITLTQSHMVQQVLQRFGFTWSSAQATPLATGHSLSAPPSDESIEPSGPYLELVGCLMYLVTCTHPDLAYPLGLLARYVAPGWHRKVHMDAAKKVLRYLCSTSGMGLVLEGRGDVVLTGHSDASWVDDQATQRSSQGYTFSLGSGSLTYLLTDLGERPRSPPVLYVNNKAAIALCQEHRLEHRTKHIALRYFLARELQQRGKLRLAHVATRANTADIFTKALPSGDHQRSSLYTLTIAPPPVYVPGQVAASNQVFAAVSRSSPTSAPCSCRPLAHDTLLWHHRLGRPSLPRLRGMASRALVSGLPRSLSPLPPGPAPTCVPCVEGRQRAAPHSSSFPPTEAPLQTLHMDVWGPARVRGQGHERYFLLVVDDYSCYTTIFPLRSKGEVPEVLIDWIRGARRQLSESFGSDLPVLRLHSYRGGEFSSDLLRAFCRSEGIRQTFTLPASPQQNGIVERHIGMVMDVARTSMIHAAAPHFLWPFAVQYAAHQINLQPRVSLPGTTSTLRWTGKVGDASAFRDWGSRAFVRDTTADKLSSRAVPCVFLGFLPDAPGWQFYHPTSRCFYHPTSRCVLSSQDVTFDESVSYYRLFPYRTASPPPPPQLFLAPSTPLVDPLPPRVLPPQVCPT